MPRDGFTPAYPVRKRREDGEIVVEIHDRGWYEVKRFVPPE